jgi:uncharacterized protein YacL
MNRTDFIENTVKTYRKQSLWLVAGTALIALFVMNIMQDLSALKSLIICIVYTFSVNAFYIGAWQGVARTSMDNLPKFYMAASALRLLLAAVVALIVCLILKNRSSIIPFIVLFSVFYILMLIFDSIFFVKKSKCLINDMK